MDSSAKKTLWWVVLVSSLFAIGTIAARSHWRQRAAFDEMVRCTSRFIHLRLDKLLFAKEYGLTNGALIDPAAFARYQATNNPFCVTFTKCPSGGTYTLNPAGVDPTCSYTNEFDYWSINFQELKIYHSKTRHRQ